MEFGSIILPYLVLLLANGSSYPQSYISKLAFDFCQPRISTLYELPKELSGIKNAWSKEEGRLEICVTEKKF